MEPQRVSRAAGVLLLASSVCATGLAGEQPAAAVDVEQVRSAIAAVGPAKVAEQVSSDSAELEAIAAGVGTGRHAWLDVGAKLIGVADPYLKDRLVQAFSYALQHDAEAVLERSIAGVPVDAVCGYDPFMAFSSLPPCKAVYRALAPRERAVARVRRPDLATTRDTCIGAIAHLKATVAQECRP